MHVLNRERKKAFTFELCKSVEEIYSLRTFLFGRKPGMRAPHMEIASFDTTWGARRGQELGI